MDADRFDALTRACGGGRSRRGVLAGLAGALAAALVGRGAAARPGVGASCTSDADCIDGRCVQGHCRFREQPGLGGCRADSDCPDRTECAVDGRCVRSCQCARGLAYYGDRFRTCFNDKEFCDRPEVGKTCCQFCADWVGCTGLFDTGTSCGRVTGNSCRG